MNRVKFIVDVKQAVPFACAPRHARGRKAKTGNMSVFAGFSFGAPATLGEDRGLIDM